MCVCTFLFISCWAEYFFFYSGLLEREDGIIATRQYWFSSLLVCSWKNKKKIKELCYNVNVMAQHLYSKWRHLMSQQFSGSEVPSEWIWLVLEEWFMPEEINLVATGMASTKLKKNVDSQQQLDEFHIICD